MNFKENIYPNMSNNDYHADKEYISSSGLKLFPDKIDEYIAKYRTKKQEKRKTAALTIGAATHTVILEPGLFDSQYVVEPEKIDKRTTEGKKIYANLMLEAESKEIINYKDHLTIMEMENSVIQHPLAFQYLMNAEIEKSFFFEHDGIKQKVRPDAVKGNIIIDLKTIDDVYKFKNSVIIYGYHFSVAMYKTIVSEVLQKEMYFVFIVVQKTYPYTTMVCELDSEVSDLGESDYISAKQSYKKIIESDSWDNMVSISVPQWAKQNMEDHTYVI